MIKKYLPKLGNWIIVIIALALTAVFIYYKYRIGVTRYFDQDEFAHLHWAYNFFSGMKPYRDYLYFFPPLYLLILYPVFLFGKTIEAILYFGRLNSFISSMFFILSCFLLFSKRKGFSFAVLAIFILSFLPLPADKLLEVRPDTWAAAFSMLGMYFFIKGINSKKILFLSGFIFALGFFIVPKTVFYPLMAFGILLFNFLKFRDKKVKYFLLGWVPVGLLVFSIFASCKDVKKAVMLTTIFAGNSTRILGEKFPMKANMFFYPGDTYYGLWGLSGPYILNLSIYIISIMIGAFALFSSIGGKKKEDIYADILISGSFIFNLLAFVNWYPLKHTQYIILFMPFAAYYFTIFLEKIMHIKYIGRIVIIIFLLYTAWQGYLMNKIKIYWTNYTAIWEIKRVHEYIPKGSYVLDLFGQGITFKDPYFICCIPYGQYIEAFNFPYPSLAGSLNLTETKYILLYYPDRINVLPPKDIKYIMDNYEVGLDYPRILIRKEK